MDEIDIIDNESVGRASVGRRNPLIQVLKSEMALERHQSSIWNPD